MFGGSGVGGLFGGQPQAQTETGGGLFGSGTTAGGAGLFGGTAQQTQQTGGGLFGGGSTTSTVGSLFGQQPQQQQAQPTSLFGGQTGGGLFGGGTTTQQQPSGGLFGTTAPAQQTGGLFGGTQQQPSAGSLFGSTQQATGGGLFGTTQQTGGGLFGTVQQPAAGGIFGGMGAPSGAAQSGTAHLKINSTFNASLGGNLTSIISDPQFQQRGKSLGYLRWEDYCNSNIPGAGQAPAVTLAVPAGGGLYGATATQPSGSLFGGAAQAQPSGLFGPMATQAGGGLFGTPQRQTGGLFGATTTTSPSAQQQAGGLFGPTSTTTGGLFGQPAQQQQPTGLFGSPQRPAAGGLFGPSAATQPTAGGGLFGPTTGAPAGGLFGGGAAAPTTGGGLFGGPTTTTAGGGLFGAAPGAQPTTGGGLFGATTTQQPSAVGGGLFGAPTTPTTGTGLFGTGAAAPTTGGGLFGGGITAPAGGGLFGAPVAQPTTTGGGLFGGTAAAPAGGLFGVGAPTSPTGGLFGAATAQPALGAPTVGGGLGAGAAPGTVGGGLFGGAAPSMAGGGLFGGGAPAGAGGGLFGGGALARPAGGGLFGATAPVTPTGGIFGAAAAPVTTGLGLGTGAVVTSAAPAAELPYNMSALSIAQAAQLIWGQPMSPPLPRTRPSLMTDSDLQSGSWRPLARGSYLDSISASARRGTTAQGEPETSPLEEGGPSPALYPPTSRRGSRISVSQPPVSSREGGVSARESLTMLRSETPGRGVETPGSAGHFAELEQVSGGPSSRIGSLAAIRPPEQGGDEITPWIVPATSRTPGPRSATPDASITGRGGMPPSPLSSRPAASVLIPRQSNPEYTMRPTREALKQYTEEQLSRVEDFTVTREQYGSIMWPGFTDVRGLDVDAAVDIQDTAVEVYGEKWIAAERRRRRETAAVDARLSAETGGPEVGVEEEEEEEEDDALASQRWVPPVGQGLNKEAIITLYNCRPSEAFAEQFQKDPEGLMKHHTEYLRLYVSNVGGQFIALTPDFTWKFRVEHFSRYAMPRSGALASIRKAVSAAATGSDLTVSAEPLKSHKKATLVTGADRAHERCLRHDAVTPHLFGGSSKVSFQSQLPNRTPPATVQRQAIATRRLTPYHFEQLPSPAIRIPVTPTFTSARPPYTARDAGMPDLSSFCSDRWAAAQTLLDAFLSAPSVPSGGHDRHVGSPDLGPAPGLPTAPIYDTVLEAMCQGMTESRAEEIIREGVWATLVRAQMDTAVTVNEDINQLALSAEAGLGKELSVATGALLGPVEVMLARPDGVVNLQSLSNLFAQTFRRVASSEARAALPGSISALVLAGALTTFGPERRIEAVTQWLAKCNETLAMNALEEARRGFKHPIEAAVLLVLARKAPQAASLLASASNPAYPRLAVVIEAVGDTTYRPSASLLRQLEDLHTLKLDLIAEPHFLLLMSLLAGNIDRLLLRSLPGWRSALAALLWFDLASDHVAGGRDASRAAAAEESGTIDREVVEQQNTTLGLAILKLVQETELAVKSASATEGLERADRLPAFAVRPPPDLPAAFDYEMLLAATGRSSLSELLGNFSRMKTPSPILMSALLMYLTGETGAAAVSGSLTAIGWSDRCRTLLKQHLDEREVESFLDACTRAVEADVAYHGVSGAVITKRGPSGDTGSCPDIAASVGSEAHDPAWIRVALWRIMLGLVGGKPAVAILASLRQLLAANLSVSEIEQLETGLHSHSELSPALAILLDGLGLPAVFIASAMAIELGRKGECLAAATCWKVACRFAASPAEAAGKEGPRSRSFSPPVRRGARRPRREPASLPTTWAGVLRARLSAAAVETDLEPSEAACASQARTLLIGADGDAYLPRVLREVAAVMHVSSAALDRLGAPLNTESQLRHVLRHQIFDNATERLIANRIPDDVVQLLPYLLGATRVGNPIAGSSAVEAMTLLLRWLQLTRCFCGTPDTQQEPWLTPVDREGPTTLHQLFTPPRQDRCQWLADCPRPACSAIQWYQATAVLSSFVTRCPSLDARQTCREFGKLADTLLHLVPKSVAAAAEAVPAPNAESELLSPSKRGSLLSNLGSSSTSRRVSLGLDVAGHSRQSLCTTVVQADEAMGSSSLPGSRHMFPVTGAEGELSSPAGGRHTSSRQSATSPRRSSLASAASFATPSSPMSSRRSSAAQDTELGRVIDVPDESPVRSRRGSTAGLTSDHQSASSGRHSFPTLASAAAAIEPSSRSFTRGITSETTRGVSSPTNRNDSSRASPREEPLIGDSPLETPHGEGVTDCCSSPRVSRRSSPRLSAWSSITGGSQSPTSASHLSSPRPSGTSDSAHGCDMNHGSSGASPPHQRTRTHACPVAEQRSDEAMTNTRSVMDVGSPLSVMAEDGEQMTREEPSPGDQSTSATRRTSREAAVATCQERLFPAADAAVMISAHHSEADVDDTSMAATLPVIRRRQAARETTTAKAKAGPAARAAPVTRRRAAIPPVAPLQLVDVSSPAIKRTRPKRSAAGDQVSASSTQITAARTTRSGRVYDSPDLGRK